jgi:predicted small lipoprotein YifL
VRHGRRRRSTQSTPSAQRLEFSADSAISALIVVIAIALATVACGKKGPPLPPLVRLPAPPDVQASRRGSTVELAVVVPGANADGSRPANVSRVDIYAITGPVTISDADLLKHGTRVASLPVKAPRNPDDTAEPDEPIEEVEAPIGNGLDQGAGTTVRDELSSAALVPADLGTPAKRPAIVRPDGPLVGVSGLGPVRTYAGVGVSTRGKQGRISRRATVSLAPAPSPPSSPTISYDEKAITVVWAPPGAPAAPSASAGNEPEVLASRTIGPLRPALGYNVYDTTSGALLTQMPVAEPRFTDTRIEWGAERCYGVRAVDPSNGLFVESEAREPRCVTLVDRFPPAAPKDLKAVSTEGVVSLIWDANAESDLAGYVILRARAPADRLEPIVSAPVLETSYNDMVQSGTRYVYAVQAVDKAGNASPLSNRVEETAR